MTETENQEHWRRQLWGTGARAPLDFQLFNFSRHLRAAQTLTLDSMWLPIQNKYSFVTVYCMNFTIFLCVTLKLFFLFVSCPSSHQILAMPLIKRAMASIGQWLT